MMRSLYTGLSGLKGHQTRMDAIGNNISNVNTVGFKSTRVTFDDMLSQNLKAATEGGRNTGGTNPKQIGLGTNVASTDLIFKDGAPVATGKNTDLAISGDGMFVVQRNGQTYYTRDGAFEFDAAGNYVLPGSGHYVQGWTATDGVIDTTGRVGDIKVAKGQTMAAKGTDFVDYYYNLDSETPIVTGISGGEEVVRQIITTEDVSEMDPIPIDFGGKGFRVSWISNDMDTRDSWVINKDISLGDTTVEVINSKGQVVNAKINPPANFEVPKGTPFGTVRAFTKNSVTEDYPLQLYIDGKTYTAIGMDKNFDLTKEWKVKPTSAPAGSNTITVVAGDGEELTFNLKTPLAEGIAEPKQIIVESRETVATETKPITLTLSDGTTRVVTDGSYKVGNSAPITSYAKIYDNMGNSHNVPVYFIRETNINDDAISSENKWLVSLTPNASVTKGETTTTEFTDGAGNKITASLDTPEIQFDLSGNLVITSESEDASDIGGMITLNYDSSVIGEDGVATTSPIVQNVTLDFTSLTQYASGTTVSSKGNGNAVGSLQNIEIDSSGVIMGSYTNGETRPEAQVAVAHFTNLPGLMKTGTSMYQESDNSGVATIVDPRSLGIVISPGYLEMSNVDVANEFADMIITQRAFQSNSKIIMVGDEMIETAVNMKR